VPFLSTTLLSLSTTAPPLSYTFPPLSTTLLSLFFVRTMEYNLSSLLWSEACKWRDDRSKRKTCGTVNAQCWDVTVGTP